MAKADNKTKPEPTAPEDMIAAVEHPRRCADAEVLLPFFTRITGWPAQMWGPRSWGSGATTTNMTAVGRVTSW